MKSKRGKGIAISQLEKGPIRHPTLPLALISRIENIADMLAEVNSQPAVEWVEDFQRDQNPEKEIVIWETMAAAYSVFTKDRNLTAEAKKEAFALLLMRSMNDERSVLNEAPLKRLRRADAVALLAAFESIASAQGWWIN